MMLKVFVFFILELTNRFALGTGGGRKFGTPFKDQSIQRSEYHFLPGFVA